VAHQGDDAPLAQRLPGGVGGAGRRESGGENEEQNEAENGASFQFRLSA
jgi:hypothetical protein